MTVRNRLTKTLAAAALFAVLAALAPGAALAGDPNRYVDRESWPDWSMARDDWNVWGGELADAIRFELVRGYPVKPVDQWGYYDREFRFFSPVTRGEFATMLSRSLSLAEDGKGGAWFVPHVEALKARGVIPADAGTDWNVPITRREAGQWMGRAAGAFGADQNRDMRTFTDVNDPLILRAARAGIVRGTTGGRPPLTNADQYNVPKTILQVLLDYFKKVNTPSAEPSQAKFEPDRTLTRGEAALMLIRLARAMNNQGNAQNPEVFRQLTEIIKEADRQAAQRSVERVKTGQISPVDPAGIHTEEFAQFLRQQILEEPPWQVPKDHREWTWFEMIESAYKFEPVEIHDNIAVVLVADAAYNAYKGLGKDRPNGLNQHYSGLQFFVKRNGKWLLSAAF